MRNLIIVLFVIIILLLVYLISVLDNYKEYLMGILLGILWLVVCNDVDLFCNVLLLLLGILYFIELLKYNNGSEIINKISVMVKFCFVFILFVGFL
jgi:hypothetical protein